VNINLESMADEANSHLIRLGAQSHSVIMGGDIFAAPGQSSSTLLLGDETVLVEGNAVEVLKILSELPDLFGWHPTWEALSHFDEAVVDWESYLDRESQGGGE